MEQGRQGKAAGAGLVGRKSSVGPGPYPVAARRAVDATGEVGKSLVGDLAGEEDMLRGVEERREAKDRKGRAEGRWCRGGGRGCH